MPNPIQPSQKKWLDKLNEVVGDNLSDTILVGHSLGCFIILRFLESKNLISSLDKVILVAGFVHPMDSKYKKYFLPEPNFELIKKRAKKIYCVYSSNDKQVSPSQSKKLAKELDAVLVLDKNKSHFSIKNNIIELPSVYKLILGKEGKNER